MIATVRRITANTEVDRTTKRYSYKVSVRRKFQVYLPFDESMWFQKTHGKLASHGIQWDGLHSVLLYIGTANSEECMLKNK